MYPISIDFDDVKKRINFLLKNEFYGEALLVSFFTLERIIKRTLKEIIVKSGCASIEANKIIKYLKTYDDINNNWEIYDKDQRGLPDIIGNDKWKFIRDVKNNEK